MRDDGQQLSMRLDRAFVSRRLTYPQPGIGSEIRVAATRRPAGKPVVDLPQHTNVLEVVMPVERTMFGDDEAQCGQPPQDAPGRATAHRVVGLEFGLRAGIVSVE